MTIVSILHFIIVEHVGIPAWILCNVWGCACIFVFMDSVVLANDLKIMENKYKALEIKYQMMEMFHKTEKQEYKEREKAYTQKENIFLVNISSQGAGLKSDISSLSSNVQMNHMDVHRALSCISSQCSSNSQFSFDCNSSKFSFDCNSSNTQSEQNTPEMHYATIPCEIKVLKQNDKDQQESCPTTKSPSSLLKKREIKGKFIDLAKQGRILSLKELGMKKRLRFGLTQSSSEIFKSSKRMQEQNDDRKNPKPDIEYKLDLKTNVMNRSPSAPHLSAVIALPMVEDKH